MNRLFAEGFAGRGRLGLAVALLLLAVSLAKRAGADVRFDGTWPEKDKLVSLDADRISRSDAVKRLADVAGWSIVVTGSPKETLDVHVKDEPANKVLTLILSDGKYVAKRDGNLVWLGVDEAPRGDSVPLPAAPPLPPPGGQIPPAIPPAPPPPPPAPLHSVAPAEDRTVTGGHLKIGPHETVHDVSVFGGSVDVYGTVTGDLAVFGGRADVHDGAHVAGSATVLGGSMRIHDGARVDRDVGVFGGHLQRDEKATVGGSVDQVSVDDDDAVDHHGRHHDGVTSKLVRDVGDAFSRAALLFVFGTIVLALGAKRVEALRIEVASRPMRSFALGVVGLIAAVALVIAMCVTVVGIPVAIVGVLVGAIAFYAGFTAVLTTLGEALLRHRTTNPYLHLALGCAILLLLSAIPYVGLAAKIFVGFTGIGVMIATRAAGLVPVRANGASSFGRH
jgi:hypothetical protein